MEGGDEGPIFSITPSVQWPRLLPNLNLTLILLHRKIDILMHEEIDHG